MSRQYNDPSKKHLRGEFGPTTGGSRTVTASRGTEPTGPQSHMGSVLRFLRRQLRHLPSGDRAGPCHHLFHSEIHSSHDGSDRVRDDLCDDPDWPPIGRVCLRPLRRYHWPQTHDRYRGDGFRRGNLADGPPARLRAMGSQRNLHLHWVAPDRRHFSRRPVHFGQSACDGILPEGKAGTLRRTHSERGAGRYGRDLFGDSGRSCEVSGETECIRLTCNGDGGFRSWSVRQWHSRLRSTFTGPWRSRRCGNNPHVPKRPSGRCSGAQT